LVPLYHIPSFEVLSGLVTLVVFCFAKNVCLSLSGSYECKLCLTLHNNEGSYLAHTQGKKHQANLARRAAKEAKESPQQVKKKLDTL
jgi:Splicing factor 3a, subunit 2